MVSTEILPITTITQVAQMPILMDSVTIIISTDLIQLGARTQMLELMETTMVIIQIVAPTTLTTLRQATVQTIDSVIIRETLQQVVHIVTLMETTTKTTT